MRELSRDTGLFTEERREESIRFIHLTFCEFLAGQIIANGRTDAWKEITTRIADGNKSISASRLTERFAEVIVFAAALEANQSTRQQRIRWAVESTSIDIALRTMVDCQAYDDSVTLQELNKIADRIAQTPDQLRDDSWLYSFRQLAITLRDKELVLRDRGNRNEVSLESFFREVVGNSVVTFQKLFLSYLRLDTSGAIAMGRAMGPEFEKDLPQLLIRALDEPDVLTYVLSEFSRGGNSLSDWASVLAVGALSHPSLPVRLSNEIADENLKAQIASHTKRRNAWYNCWAMRDTLLGYIFEAGCHWPGSSKVLQVMARLPVRRTQLVERFLSITLTAWSLLATSLVIWLLAWPLDDAYPSEPLSIIAAVSFLVLFFAIINTLTLSIRRIPPSRYLTYYRHYSGGIADEISSLYAQIVGADFRIRTFRYYRFLRRKAAYGTKTSRRSMLLRNRLLKHYPSFLRWSPNSKLRIFGSLGFYLALIESGRYGSEIESPVEKIDSRNNPVSLDT